MVFGSFWGHALLCEIFYYVALTNLVSVPRALCVSRVHSVNKVSVHESFYTIVTRSLVRPLLNLHLQ